MKALLPLLASLSLLTGCTSMSKVIKELKNDPATVRFKVMAPGWAVDFERSFPTNWVPPVKGSGSVTITPTPGLQVERTP